MIEISYANLTSIIGHRGACGRAPENTLASIRMAASLGCQWVELDVCLSADGTPVIFHDSTLERCTNGQGLLLQKSLAALKRLDAGRWFGDEFAGATIPTLDEALDVIIELGLGLNLEIKATAGWETPTTEATLRVLRARWPSHQPLIVSSFSLLAMQRVAELMPEVARGYIVDAIPPDWQARQTWARFHSLHFYAPLFDRQRCQALKAAGLYLLSFTVNDLQQAQGLLNAGVDALFTDYPDQLIPALTPLSRSA